MSGIYVHYNVMKRSCEKITDILNTMFHIIIHSQEPCQFIF